MPAVDDLENNRLLASKPNNIVDIFDAVALAHMLHTRKRRGGEIGIDL